MRLDSDSELRGVDWNSVSCRDGVCCGNGGCSCVGSNGDIGSGGFGGGTGSGNSDSGGGGLDGGGGGGGGGSGCSGTGICCSGSSSGLDGGRGGGGDGSGCSGTVICCSGSNSGGDGGGGGCGGCGSCGGGFGCGGGTQCHAGTICNYDSAGVGCSYGERSCRGSGAERNKCGDSSDIERCYAFRRQEDKFGSVKNSQTTTSDWRLRSEIMEGLMEKEKTSPDVSSCLYEKPMITINCQAKNCGTKIEDLVSSTEEKAGDERGYVDSASTSLGTDIIGCIDGTYKDKAQGALCNTNDTDRICTYNCSALSNILSHGKSKEFDTIKLCNGSAYSVESQKANCQEGVLIQGSSRLIQNDKLNTDMKLGFGEEFRGIIHPADGNVKGDEDDFGCHNSLSIDNCDSGDDDAHHICGNRNSHDNVGADRHGRPFYCENVEGVRGSSLSETLVEVPTEIEKPGDTSPKDRNNRGDQDFGLQEKNKDSNLLKNLPISSSCNGKGFLSTSCNISGNHESGSPATVASADGGGSCIKDDAGLNCGDTVSGVERTKSIDPSGRHETEQGEKACFDNCAQPTLVSISSATPIPSPIPALSSTSTQSTTLSSTPLTSCIATSLKTGGNTDAAGTKTEPDEEDQESDEMEAEEDEEEEQGEPKEEKENDQLPVYPWMKSQFGE